METKKESKGFTGQLAGNVKKEMWLADFRQANNIGLPKVGEDLTIDLSQDKLSGEMLSCFDNAGSLTIDGKKVSKIAVYNGEIELPKKFNLQFVLHHPTETSYQLKGNITTKKGK